MSDNLRLGIDAARAGQAVEARKYLVAALKQDPHNVPAMLWLAFVLSSPHDSIRLLERVLSLDPENERAKAGLRWARGRLGLTPDEPDSSKQTSEEQAQPQTGEAVSDSPDREAQEQEHLSFRQRLLSGKVHKQAQKGVLAQRARRTINPLLLIIFVTGILGLVAIGVGALTFMPSNVLAAWLPASEQFGSFGMDIAPVEPIELTHPSVEAPTNTTAKALTLQSDVLNVPARSPADRALTKTGPSEVMITEPSAEITDPENRVDPNFTPVDPSSLLGPQLPELEEVTASPAEDLSLAYQPADPDEKWIEVNVTTQQVTAWEGTKLIFSFIASTGLPNTPTVLGEFRIYWKLKSTLMVGDNYYLPEVPYTMYFYRDYALHGTYWHNNFGQPMSHGCVNLETGNAKKLFEWADPVIPAGQTEVVATVDNPGTLVVVHE
jgi:lipoprotein-anchoring transpeptidase ErfK/SrfK